MIDGKKIHCKDRTMLESAEERRLPQSKACHEPAERGTTRKNSGDDIGQEGSRKKREKVLARRSLKAPSAEGASRESPGQYPGVGEGLMP